jgi:putative membrane protein
MRSHHGPTLKHLAIAVSVAGLLLAGCAADRHDGMGASSSGSQSVSGSSTVASEDSSFARQACHAGAAEIEIGRMAAVNTRNKAIRKIARTLSDDHARAEKELSALFTRKQMPPEPELTEDFRHSLQRLAEMKGGAFDAAFKRQVIEDHERAIAMFEKQAEQGTDPDLKAFAENRLPHLREHLATARLLPISADLDGPTAEPNINAVLQNPGFRTSIPR